MRSGTPRCRNALPGADVIVEIPLHDGENDFTLVGQPGITTAVDLYERYAINLYFDRVLDYPGIAVLYPRNNNRNRLAV